MRKEGVIEDRRDGVNKRAGVNEEVNERLHEKRKKEKIWREGKRERTMR